MTFSTLGWFAAECEATGKKISASKSKVVGGSVRVIPVSQFKYVRFLFMSEGKMEQETDGQFGAACTIAEIVPDCWGEEVTEPQGKALHLAVCLSKRNIDSPSLSKSTRLRIKVPAMTFLWGRPRTLGHITRSHIPCGLEAGWRPQEEPESDAEKKEVCNTPLNLLPLQRNLGEAEGNG